MVDASRRTRLRLEFEENSSYALSTASLCGLLGDGSETEVASTDDIHTPVEKPEDTQKPHKHEKPSVKKPPGQFVSDELESHTKRFLEEVKGLAKRRREAPDDELRLPPPDKRQRSRRR
jgi:hypothetical protein